MAIAMHGLRVRPQYEDLIGVAKSDGLGNNKFPNRDSDFFEKVALVWVQKLVTSWF